MTTETIDLMARVRDTSLEQLSGEAIAETRHARAAVAALPTGKVPHDQLRAPHEACMRDTAAGLHANTLLTAKMALSTVAIEDLLRDLSKRVNGHGGHPGHAGKDGEPGILGKGQRGQLGQRGQEGTGDGADGVDGADASDSRDFVPGVRQHRARAHQHARRAVETMNGPVMTAAFRAILLAALPGIIAAVTAVSQKSDRAARVATERTQEVAQVAAHARTADSNSVARLVTVASNLTELVFDLTGTPR